MKILAVHAHINPLTDKQLFASTVLKQDCRLRLLYNLIQGDKTISQRAARRLIALHPRQINRSTVS